MTMHKNYSKIKKEMMEGVKRMIFVRKNESEGAAVDRIYIISSNLYR